MLKLSINAFNTTETGKYNETDTNSTGSGLSTSDLVLGSVSLLISLIGLIGNGIVLWFLGFKIRRNKFTVYILNLAVADFLFLLCYCILLVCIFIVLHVFAISMSAIIIVQAFFIFAYNTDLYLLTAISVERCLSVLYPLWYQCQRPKHQSSIVCGLLWAFSCLVSLIESFLCKEEDHKIGSYSSCEQGVFISLCVLNFLVFTPLMVFSSITLLIRIWRTSQLQHPPKLYIVIVATVVVFLAFALPLRLASLLRYRHVQHPESFEYISVLCSSISCTSNPFIYFLVGSLSKQKAKDLLQGALGRVFKDETEQETETTNSQITKSED
ncbi:proto-oncogene Mas-like [Microcaecilia unicolor]|uniref:Proto-oncogene Mas-like n=1 Tax=Microcaecilia unicolor TaxID=1415580 RepID=A0A6P7X7K2_9AMPH|nr:proto-oncogene Mas-like [Microcaecilia unicolor]